MFWKKTDSKLRIGPQSNAWGHRIVKSPLVSAQDGDSVDYCGWAYVFEGGQQGAAFSAQGTRNTMQRAMLTADIAVSRSVHVAVLCNGERVWSDLLKVPDQSSTPTLHRLSVDITRQAERRAVSDIGIEFVFATEPGTLWILCEQTAHWSPKIEQIPSWPYAIGAFLVFAVAWIGLAGLLVVGISASRFIDDPRLTMPIAVLGALLGYLGLRDLAKLPLGDGLRKIYSWTKEPTGPIVIAALLAMSASAVLAAWVCLDGSLRRYRYTNLIESHENDTQTLIRAFMLEPWRREAQVLFEQVALLPRMYSDRTAFREYVRMLTDDEMVLDAIGQAGSKPPVYLDGDSGSVSDPVIWIASILPEGDAANEWDRTDKAIELLDTRKETSCGARLHQLVLSIQRSQSQERVYALRDELEQSTNTCKIREPTNYSVQLALDMLGNISIVTDFEEAARYFKELLRVRSAALDHQRLSWRAPDKLILYALFRSYFDDISGKDDPVITRARPILEYEREGLVFGDVFKTAVYNVHESFQGRDAWHEGTIVGSGTPFDVSATLNSGWRF